jgi:hypothetical protein
MTQSPACRSNQFFVDGVVPAEVRTAVDGAGAARVGVTSVDDVGADGS